MKRGARTGLRARGGENFGKPRRDSGSLGRETTGLPVPLLSRKSKIALATGDNSRYRCQAPHSGRTGLIESWSRPVLAKPGRETSSRGSAAVDN